MCFEICPIHGASGAELLCDEFGLQPLDVERQTQGDIEPAEQVYVATMADEFDLPCVMEPARGVLEGADPMHGAPPHFRAQAPGAKRRKVTKDMFACDLQAVTLGCPKCRRASLGCIECRRKAGLRFDDESQCYYFPA